MAIDYVVPMVFADDKEWQELHKKVGSCFDSSNPYEHVRYRNWGTEHLLIRCVKTFMPWVRTIYVILAQESQMQPWMDDEGVRVVYHRDIIPSRFLPTFNSRGIEMFLHNIPGISKTFLYGNDDMFPVAPLKEEDFFVDGLPCQRYTTKDFPVFPNQYHLACLNGLNFVAREFGIRYERKWLKGGHSISPILLTTCRYLWQHYGTDIERSLTPYRDVCNYNQYIYGWWQHFKGMYVEHAPSRKYVNVKSGVDSIREVLASDDYSIVCVNDNEAVDDIEPFAAVVRTYLEKKLNSYNYGCEI
jgi:hypothetical protein